jgi:hypothetical protein
VNKRIRIDFYRLVMPSGTTAFETLVEAAGKLPNDESRTRTVNGAPVRLHSSKTTAKQHEGELVRIRMDTAPARASIKGPLRDFDFGDDEGMGEETAFLYDPTYQILVVQRNHYGVSASSLAGYFEQIGAVTPITLEPIIEPDKLAKFNALTEVRQFQVSVAGIENAATIGQQHPSAGVKKMAELVETFDAPAVNVYLSMEHEHGSLNVQRVKAAAKRFVKIGEDKDARVKKVEISGRTPDDDLIVVDLIKDRMVEEADVVVNPKRRLPYANRSTALKAAYAARLTQLQALFGTGSN